MTNVMALLCLLKVRKAISLNSVSFLFLNEHLPSAYDDMPHIAGEHSPGPRTYFAYPALGDSAVQDVAKSFIH
jgi:hypothetical protein